MDRVRTLQQHILCLASWPLPEPGGQVSVTEETDAIALSYGFNCVNLQKRYVGVLTLYLSM